MKKKIALLTLPMILLGAVAFLSPSPAPEAAPPCVQCPLAPLPDECPPCTEFVPQTCRRCAYCKPIRGCNP